MSVNPVVAATNDGLLSDLAACPITRSLRIAGRDVGASLLPADAVARRTDGRESGASPANSCVIVLATDASLDALCRAETITGRDGWTEYAIDVDALGALA